MDVWNGGRNRPRLAGALALAVWVTSPGCTIAPKRFGDTVNPAPLVRARAATMGDHLPTQLVVPALLERLDDGDPVVRLTAHEELKRRTGQDFGYRPWDDPTVRAGSIARWRAWWAGMTRTSEPKAQTHATAQSRRGRAGVTRTAGPATTGAARQATSRPRTSATGATQVRQTLPHVPPTGG
jgi:hypothetical protein